MKRQLKTKDLDIFITYKEIKTYAIKWNIIQTHIQNADSYSDTGSENNFP